MSKTEPTFPALFELGETLDRLGHAREPDQEPRAWCLVPVEPPIELAPLLIGYDLAGWMPEETRAVLLERLHKRWADILAIAGTEQPSPEPPKPG